MGWASNAWFDDAWLGTAWSTGEDIGVSITNPNAETRVLSGNEICDMTGQKLYPGESRRDYMGHSVRPRSFDTEPYREFQHHRVTNQSEARFTEQEDTFISTSISPEDL